MVNLANSNGIFKQLDPEHQKKVLISYLDNIRDIVVEARRPFDREWKENLAFYLGDQINPKKRNKKAFWRSSSVSNGIFPVVEQLHALMTDERSIPFAERRAGGTQRMQNILTDLIEQVWENNLVEVENSNSISDSLIFGTGIFKTTWDFKNKSKKDPLKIKVRRIDTRNFFNDPLAKGINDSRYMLEQMEMGVSTLIERFPDKFSEILASKSDVFDDVFDRERRTILNEKRINVWEAWFTDQSRLVLLDDRPTQDGEAEIKKAKQKFPTGRRVLFVGDVILEDEKNPYDWFPYSVAPLSYVPDEFWGLSLVTNLKKLQTQKNDVRDMIFDNLKSNINSIFTMTEGAADLDEIVPVPGTVISLRGEGASFDRVQGVSLPSEAFNMDSLISEEMLRLSGVNEATFGSTIGSTRPGTIQTQFNASLTRMREYLRKRNNLMLKDVGKKCIWLIQKFLPENTIVSISNPDNDVSNLKSPDNLEIINDVLQTERVQGEASRINVTLNQRNPDFDAGVEQRMNPPEESGVLGLSEKQAREVLIKDGISEFKAGTDVTQGSYNFKVDIHPIQTRDQNSLFEFMTSLLQFGLADPLNGKDGFIDAEFFYENVPLPGKERLVRRLLRQKEEFRRIQQQQLDLQRRQVEAQEALVQQAQGNPAQSQQSLQDLNQINSQGA